jgi:hypothetical protein
VENSIFEDPRGSKADSRSPNSATSRWLGSDVNDNTAQLACRVILDVLGTLVDHGISATATR